MNDAGRHARGRIRPSFVPAPRGEAVPAATDPRPATRPLDPTELVWLAEARELLRGPRVDLTDVAWLGSHLDSLMASWHRSPSAARWDPSPTTTAVGLAVGDAVIARVPGLGWVYALHAPGSPYALAHPRTVAVELPVDAVAHLWTQGVPNLLPALVDELAGRATGRAARPDEPGRLTGALRLLNRRR